MDDEGSQVSFLRTIMDRSSLSHRLSLSIGVHHMSLWENHSNFKTTTYALPLFDKTVICVLPARDLSVTSDGEGNGPVRRIARGGRGSGLLEGGWVEGDEVEEPGAWPWNGEGDRGDDQRDGQ
ncbi:hypothetical protein K443DRAFT_13012 [Laccaria amethystina LaAM-08-1]|uniref:Uncharacterized protein n=1 Tax=Laccaria amethystina LaAM-08-1 TaxID=1095629 RepID=A0A0C9WWN3_9AGAR|nr:hypothetical protein K443DRAFT_13012 [Laccaria amethystina LaAM-08-1]